MQTPRKQSSTSTRLVWRAFVEIENEDGTSTPRGLVSQHTLIGRSPSAPLMLDHDTVSRRHAEIFCDPFARWWLRDLGSTNGSSVNGERIDERILQHGDRIGIGDLRMRFKVGISPDSSRAKETLEGAGAVALRAAARDGGEGSWVKSLSEIATPQISAAHLSLVTGLSRRLLNLDQAKSRLAAIAELMVSEGFHGVMSMALRVRVGSSVPTAPEIISGPHHAAGTPTDQPPYISRGVLNQVVTTGEPTLGSNLPEKDASLELTISADVVPLAAAASPLGRDGDAIDILYVTLPPHYGRAEWLALIALAAEAYQQAEVVWTARSHEADHVAIERELETARQIQRALIPAGRSFPGLELAIGFEPCRWVGGDYVGSVATTGGRVLLSVADVCGKGLQPALVTFSVHTMISALSDTGRSIEEMMVRLNTHLCEYMPSDSFVTMACVLVDPATGDIEVVNAGHLPPLVIGREGAVRRLQSEVNPVLGVGRCDMTTQRSRLERGEVLFLYTDGLTELRDPSRNMLGEQALAENVARIYAAKANAALSVTLGGLTAMLDDYRAGELREDDQAILLARRA
ncbi:MAG: SpoIIE family protein phosphatase [Polyangiaceae bacterium]